MHNKVRDIFYSLFTDNNKYLTYKEGTTNILLSAPHGGGIKPLNIPNRVYGNKGQDTYTRRLIQRIVELLDKEFAPYYIYSDIHRSKVDLNREIKEGAQSNPIAEKVWHNWNRIIREYIYNIRQDYKKGLYIDIHSHNNSNQFQIGYGFSVKNYLNLRKGLPVSAHSTMYSLKLSGQSEYYTLFGSGSFVRSLELDGFKVLIPEAENKYLNGGRGIKVFSGNGIGAIQIECPISVLKSNLNGVAISLTAAIERYRENFLYD